MLTLKHIGYHNWVFCKKYGVVIVYANDPERVKLSMGLMYYCVKFGFSIVAMNESEGLVLSGKLAEAADLELTLSMPETILKLKAHYITRRVTLPVVREVVTINNKKQN